MVLTHMRQARVSCALGPDAVDTHFVSMSHAQRVLLHAWHAHLVTMLPSQTSAHPEGCTVF